MNDDERTRNEEQTVRGDDTRENGTKERGSEELVAETKGETADIEEEEEEEVGKTREKKGIKMGGIRRGEGRSIHDEGGKVDRDGFDRRCKMLAV